MQRRPSSRDFTQLTKFKFKAPVCVFDLVFFCLFVLQLMKVLEKVLCISITVPLSNRRNCYFQKGFEKSDF